MKYYLAYGSNLNKTQMKMRCPHAEVVGTSEIPGYRLLYKGSMSGSYLTIEKAEGRSVPVGVWSVDNYDEANLDRYEGYPSFYYKKSMVLEADMENGEKKTLDCFVYIMHEERPFGIPSRYYVDRCREGYRDFGFDEKVLDRALSDTKGEFRFRPVGAKVTPVIKEQIIDIRDTGLTNMFDGNTVQTLALDYGYKELYEFIDDYPDVYFRFILTGK